MSSRGMRAAISSGGGLPAMPQHGAALLYWRPFPRS